MQRQQKWQAAAARQAPSGMLKSPEETVTFHICFCEKEDGWKFLWPEFELDDFTGAEMVSAVKTSH